MIKRDELKGPSCLTHAADEEPLFVLRANDELAPQLVRDWARRYLVQKDRPTGAASAQQLAKVDEALELAQQMETWKAARVG